MCTRFFGLVAICAHILFTAEAVVVTNTYFLAEVTLPVFYLFHI